MPLTRDPEMLARQDRAARIDHNRSQRALVRIDPDHVAGVIRGQQQMRGPRAPVFARGHHDRLPSRPRRAIPLQMRTADNIPVGAKRLAERSYQVRPILEGTNRGRHFETKTPANGSDTSRSQAPVPPSTLRQPSLAPGTQNFNTGIPCGTTLGVASPLPAGDCESEGQSEK